MFEDSLIESSGVLKTKQKMTAAVCLLLQSLLLAVMVTIPFFYTQALPSRIGRIVEQLLPPPPPAPTQQSQATRAITSEIADGKLLEPQHIPKAVTQIEETGPAPSVTSIAALGVPNGILGSTGTGLPGILSASPGPPPNTTQVQRVTVSRGVAQGYLIRQVTPVYPSLARQARIQGTVLLEAVIAKNGSIENLRVLSGHPMLSPAAIEAVKQWRYRPYSLNGEPVEVETQITVNFTL